MLWKKEFGVLDSGPQRTDLQWGHASSPVISGSTLLLQADQKKGSFLVALSIEDGKELWRVDRDGVSGQSWATPTVIKTGGRTQVVCNGYPFIASYDLSTGKELWRMKSGGDIPVPAPVFAHGLIFITNAHGGQAPLYAVRPDASGDLSLTDGKTSNGGIAWSEPRNGAYMQTPLVVGDLLYSCSDGGVLKVYAATTGELKYAQRLGSGKTGFTSSPVGVGGRIYLTSEEGEALVIQAGPRFELLASNRMGELVLSSPAVASDTLFFRTRHHVVAVGN